MARNLNHPMDPNLEDFLRRVDELESVVQGTAALDKPQEGGISPAGEGQASVRQQREPVDRTVINHAAFSDNAPKGIQRKGAPTSLYQDDFMSAVEADANERAQNRKKRREEATALKEQGNQAFQTGNYAGAVELYTEGLGRLKDFVVLYTNRAQAYNKLEKFPEAVEDCKTALQLEPRNIKALLHLGKAHQGLKEYDAAVKTYQDILKMDQRYEKIVKEYIGAARLAESMAASAQEAQRLFNEGDAGATGVVQILSKLKQPFQPPLYYAGGMRILCISLNDDSSRAQFRAFGGFNLLSQNAVIQRSLDEAAAGEDLMSGDRDLICATLGLLTSAVTDNEENIVFLIKCAAPSLFVDLLSKAHSENGEIQLGCLKLLLTLSKNASGRYEMLERLDVFRLLTTLMSILHTPMTRAMFALACKFLNNIAPNERFLPRLLATMKGFTDLNTVFTQLLNDTKVDQQALLYCISIMARLTTDKNLIFIMATKEVTVAVIATTEIYTKKQATQLDQKILVDLLGLLVNLFFDRGPKHGLGLHKELTALVVALLPLLESDNEKIRKRAVCLLSLTLPSTIEGVTDLAKQNVVPKIIDVMKSEDVNRGIFGLKCLAVLTQRSEKARKDLVKTDKALKYILEHVNGDNTSSVANAALVIGHCTQVPGLSSSLANSDVIKTLLSKTDTTSGAIKENCAIALAKLATTDQRHLDELRKLGGIGILHSCMKYVKS